MSGDATTVTIETIKGWLGGGFHDFLQMELAAYEPETASLTLALPYREAYARIAAVGDYHGGVLSAFLDVAGTFAAALAAGRIVATANIRTDYLRAPVKVDLSATARVLRAGRTLITCDVALADSDAVTYAIGRGTWTVPTRVSGTG